MSAQIEFTTQWLKELEPVAGKQLEYFDSKLANGFGVRVGARSKTFFVSYRAGGRKRRYTVGHFPQMSLKEARQQARIRQANELDPGRLREQERSLKNFAGLVAKFKEAYQSQVRVKTWSEYRRQLDTLCSGEKGIEPWGELPISEITRSRVKLYLVKKAEKAPFASNRVRAVLSKLFTWANDIELIEVNPLSGVKPAAKEASRDRVLKHDEIRRVWNAVGQEQPVVSAYFRMLFLTGLRRSEVLNAEWANIDFEKGVWSVPRTATKSGFQLDVPITDAMREILDALRAFSGETSFVFASFYGPDEPKPIVGTSKTKARIARRSGVDNWRVHDIRRSVTSELGEMGVPENVQRALLGHRIPGALHHYQRGTYSLQKRQALEGWAKRLEEIVSTEPQVLEFQAKTKADA